MRQYHPWPFAQLRAFFSSCARLLSQDGVLEFQVAQPMQQYRLCLEAFHLPWRYLLLQERQAMQPFALVTQSVLWMSHRLFCLAMLLAA